MADEGESSSLLGENSAKSQNWSKHSEFELHGMWFLADIPGIILSCLVWSLVLFVVFVMVYLAQLNYIELPYSAPIIALAVLTLWCHLKIVLTEPGVIPFCAVPAAGDEDRMRIRCTSCTSYKPPLAHHGKPIVKRSAEFSHLLHLQTESSTGAWRAWTTIVPGPTMQSDFAHRRRSSCS